MIVILMVALALLAFFVVFFISRDKSYARMLNEMENLGFSQSDVFISNTVETMAGNKQSGRVLYAKSKGGVKLYTFPAKMISRWYEHEEKVDKETKHFITIVVDIDDIGEVTFMSKDKKVIANASSYFDLLQNITSDVDSEVRQRNIPGGQCVNNQIGIIFGSVSALLIVAIFSFFGVFSSKPTEADIAAERDQRIERGCNNEANAIGHSRQFVRGATRGSVSFVRSEEKTRKLGQCAFMVFGAVDGENLFGGTVRNYYTIKMEGHVEHGELKWYGSTPLIDSSRSAVQQVYRTAD